jgi:ankyrin repeat and fibronectin type-III domain-containing protein 1
VHVPSNLKATNLTKFISKISTNNEGRHCSEIIDKNLQQILDFSQYNKNEKPLSKGLYLAYLKIQSSIDAIKILVSNQRPYFLPYTKISHNPNISKYFWNLVVSLFLEKLIDFIFSKKKR